MRILFLSEQVVAEEANIMRTLVSKLLAVRFDRSAVTSLEYGLIASLIAVVIITSVKAVGANLSAEFLKVATSI
jgi:pilus assembly protein Flp/PilA